jgi:hypothetical protein
LRVGDSYTTKEGRVFAMKDDSTERKFVPVFRSHYDSIRMMDEREGNVLLRAIVDFEFYGTIPELSGQSLMIWTAIFPTLDCNVKRAAAGRLGGLVGGKASKRNNPNGRRGNAGNEPQETTAPAGGTTQRARFTPPTVEEVAAYVKEKGFQISPTNFVDFYTARGWKVGQNSMKDWKAAVRTWVNRDNDRHAAPSQPGGSVTAGGLGVGEWRDKDGNRRYSETNDVIVPDDAPPRPTMGHWWSPESQGWVNI